MFDVFGWAELALGARWWHPEARFLDFDGTRRLFSPPQMRLEETLSLTPALLQEKEKHAQFPGIFSPWCSIASWEDPSAPPCLFFLDSLPICCSMLRC